MESDLKEGIPNHLGLVGQEVDEGGEDSDLVGKVKKTFRYTPTGRVLVELENGRHAALNRLAVRRPSTYDGKPYLLRCSFPYSDEEIWVKVYRQSDKKEEFPILGFTATDLGEVEERFWAHIGALIAARVRGY